MYARVVFLIDFTCSRVTAKIHCAFSWKQTLRLIQKCICFDLKCHSFTLHNLETGWCNIDKNLSGHQQNRQQASVMSCPWADLLTGCTSFITSYLNVKILLATLAHSCTSKRFVRISFQMRVLPSYSKLHVKKILIFFSKEMNSLLLHATSVERNKLKLQNRNLLRRTEMGQRVDVKPPQH